MDIQSINLGQIGLVAFVWLLVAIVIEEASNTLFKWKFFKIYFDGKGLKTPIIFIVAGILCLYYDIDIFQALMKSIGITVDSGIITCVLTALLLTGGSGTVFRTFNRIREGKDQLTQNSPPKNSD